jgi:biopolymer transport protein ExbB/TolQ
MGALLDALGSPREAAIKLRGVIARHRLALFVVERQIAKLRRLAKHTEMIYARTPDQDAQLRAQIAAMPDVDAEAVLAAVERSDVEARERATLLRAAIAAGERQAAHYRTQIERCNTALSIIYSTLTMHSGRAEQKQVLS